SPAGPTAAVSIALTCTSGTVDSSPKNASPGNDAVFTVTGYNPGATCDASEGSAPAGYDKDESGCQGLAFATSPTCTLTPTLPSDPDTSRTRSSPAGPTAAVSIALTCTSGTVDSSPKNASPGNDAVFTVTGYNPGATCDASEGSAPAGYD